MYDDYDDNYLQLKIMLFGWNASPNGIDGRTQSYNVLLGPRWPNDILWRAVGGWWATEMDTEKYIESLTTNSIWLLAWSYTSRLANVPSCTLDRRDKIRRKKNSVHWVINISPISHVEHKVNFMISKENYNQICLIIWSCVRREWPKILQCQCPFNHPLWPMGMPYAWHDIAHCPYSIEKDQSAI